MKNVTIRTAEVERILRAVPDSPAVAKSEQPEPEWPKLADEAMYGLPGEIVRQIEPHSEADPVALLGHALVSFGNMAGPNPHYRVGGARHGANLYVTCVGVTAGGRKGTALADTLSVIRDADDYWSRNAIASGLSSGEGLVWAVRDPIEESQPIKDKGRVTEYQTVQVDQGVEDKRKLVTEPEIGSTLRIMDRDGNSLSGVVRQLWDSGDVQTLTKQKAARTTGAHVSIIGHVTRHELGRYLGRTEQANGFANRFLWLLVKRSKFLPDGGNLQRVDWQPLRQELSRVLRHAKSTHEVTRTKAAGEAWRSIYEALAADRLGMFGAVTSRAEAQVLRLSLIYALFDGKAQIDVPHLQAAVAVWQYAEISARVIFGNALGDPVADEILKALQGCPVGMTRTDLSNTFGQNKRAGEIDRALSLLKGYRLVYSEREETGGRVAERFYVS
jgi:hypothetical protein